MNRTRTANPTDPWEWRTKTGGGTKRARRA